MCKIKPFNFLVFVRIDVVPILVFTDETKVKYFFFCSTPCAQLLYLIVKTPTPTQHNTMVGFDTKMTVQTPPTETFQALLDELES